MLKINIQDVDISITPEPLTREAFSQFGDVVSNPRPDIHPHSLGSANSTALPNNGQSTNQGTSIIYPYISRIQNLYSQSPSGKSENKMSFFVCAPRELDNDLGGPDSQGRLNIRFLERHPFTSQTFTPVPSSASTYLVVAAPSLPPSSADEHFPVPTGEGLPGRGLPDLKGIRAFIATSNQTVTYGAGTWHAPMCVLGSTEKTLDFVVMQFSSSETIEDIQLVGFESDGSKEPRVIVQIPKELLS